MTDMNFRLESLHVVQFGSLCDFRLQAEGRLCEFFIKDEQSARDLCDFIAEFLYSSQPPDGEMVLMTEKDGPLCLRVREGLRSQEGNALADGQELPGLALTGLNEEIFRELLMNFVHEGVPTPVSPTLLDFFLQPYHAPGKLMRNIRSLDEKKLLYTTPDQTGKSDLALRRHRELSELLETEEPLKAQRNEVLRELEGYNAKLDENAKRSVIIKADMNTYADDVKLMENRENASHLKNEIQAKEKRLRIMKYDAQREVPMPQPIELFDIKQAYSDFSRVSAQLRDNQNRLTEATDRLEQQKSLFAHADYDAESVHRDYCRIERNRKGRWGFLFTCAALTFLAFVTFLLLFFSDCSAAFSILVGGSVFLAALMCLVASTMFSHSTRGILVKLHIKTRKDFDRLHDRLREYEKEKLRLAGEIETLRQQCTLYSRLTEDQKDKLRELLAYTELPLDTTAQISHLCDRILSNSDAIRELEQQLAQQKQTYQRMLCADVNKTTLTVSNEFLSLERELDFLQRQTTALLSKKDKGEQRLAQLDQGMEQLRVLRQQLEETEREIEQLSREYNSICALQKPHLKEAASLKDYLETNFCEAADTLLRNIRKPGEHFALSDRLMPMVVCRDRIVAGEGDDSYLARAAMLIYKLLLSMEYLKHCPLFFFDGFSFLDQNTARDIIAKLTEKHYQLLLLHGPNSHSVKELLK